MTNRFKFGLVGNNIGYSRSAEIFEAIFDIKNIKGEFKIHDIAARDFNAQFPELLKTPLNGLSVTIPFKSSVIPFLHDIDPVAEALDAVNSVAIRDGQACGFNTDGYGFSLPLMPYADRLKQRTALIFGCGGAARAVVYSLYTNFEVRRFVVVGRLAGNLKKFRASFESRIEGLKIEVATLGFTDELTDFNYEIAVNCTPVGGANLRDHTPFSEWFQWRPGKIYYDLNYNNNNPLVKLAQDNKMLSIDGSAMLVGQALRSFSLWTGLSQKFEPVYERVFGDRSKAGSGT